MNFIGINIMPLIYLIELNTEPHIVFIHIVFLYKHTKPVKTLEK